MIYLKYNDKLLNDEIIQKIIVIPHIVSIDGPYEETEDVGNEFRMKIVKTGKWLFRITDITGSKHSVINDTKEKAFEEYKSVLTAIGVS